MLGNGWSRPDAPRVCRALIVGLGACGIAMLLGVTETSAQAWWTAVEDGRPVPSIATSLPHNGDPTSLRKWLASHGVVYGLEYTNDVLSNVRGGSRTGTIDQGKLHGILTIDFGKLAGWDGLSLFANIFQIHNTGRIRRDYVGGMNTIAAIEAVPTTRLSELWLEQKLLNGRASVRFGQLAADAEFFFSDLSATTLFLQSDWPTITAVNLPSGGAAYPLSTPGVRFKYQPTNEVALLFAVLNGDPAGPGFGDEQLRNRYGLNFRVNDPPFIIGEAQFRTNHGKDDTGLARHIKIGGWAHLGKFNDQRFASDGTLLANPLGSGVPLQYRGNLGIFGVIEQQLYRPQGAGPDGGISVFSRVSFSPSDRNLVDAYIDGGIVFAGFIPGRPDDRFGASVIYARFSDSVRAFDRDTVALTGIAVPIRDYEANLELTYVAQLVPGWTVQPVLTQVWHPNGDASRNATVFGARSIWRY
jgi:porin